MVDELVVFGLDVLCDINQGVAEGTVVWVEVDFLRGAKRKSAQLVGDRLQRVWKYFALLCRYCGKSNACLYCNITKNYAGRMLGVFRKIDKCARHSISNTYSRWTFVQVCFGAVRRHTSCAGHEFIYSIFSFFGRLGSVLSGYIDGGRLTLLPSSNLTLSGAWLTFHALCIILRKPSIVRILPYFFIQTCLRSVWSYMGLPENIQTAPAKKRSIEVCTFCHKLMVDSVTLRA